MISRTRAKSPRCGRWKACLGGGRLQRIGLHFWNRNTTQMSSIDLSRTLRKLLAAFRTFQHQFSPDRNRNQCTHAAELSPPSWNATHTVVDVHPRASTERMQRNTDLQFCTYTCTELSRVPLCCHFATYYNFPEKKSVPELNDQPMYVPKDAINWPGICVLFSILSDASIVPQIMQGLLPPASFPFQYVPPFNSVKYSRSHWQHHSKCHK